MAEISNQYGRVKGAEWFPYLHKQDVLVLGAGGIGSWLALLLSRIGCNIHLFDMDLYEEHNMSGQAVIRDSIGKLKTEATKELIGMFSPDCEVTIYGEYTEDSMTNNIVLCGFDNMKARKIAFENWKEFVNAGDDDLSDEEMLAARKQCFFVDGRLNAEQMQIFCIRGDRLDDIKKYEEEELFDDAEVQDAECTFKQTSHNAAMIGAKMVAFLVNWTCSNIEGSPFRVVPFSYEYVPPLNLSS